MYMYLCFYSQSWNPNPDITLLFKKGLFQSFASHTVWWMGYGFGLHGFLNER